MDSDQYLNRLQDFLSSPLPNSLFTAHPNDVAKPSFTLPSEWDTWWRWAASTPEPWAKLLRHYMGQGPSADIPSSLSQLIDTVKALQLTRSQGLPPVPAGYGTQLDGAQYPNWSKICTQASVQRMSPKKSHEVSVMTAHILYQLRTSPTLKGAHYVVDIGAGQGHLSWNLRDLGMHVLALDSSDTQANGAERQRSYHKSSGDQGSLTYQVAMITPSSLLQLVDKWITDFFPLIAESHPLPVVFVALHACGSLTTDILRTSVSAMHGGGDKKRGWSLRATFIVGCCYNLMEERDFPLCSGISGNGLSLLPSHLQLAAQVPSTWLDHKERADVILRKVSWRALLEVTTTEREPDRDNLTGRKRLGRVSNTSYQDWGRFLQMSSVKLHRIPIPGMELFPKTLVHLEKQISTLHTLRSLLGPCVESLIVWDRYAWLMEVSRREDCFEVYLLNLFDQKRGSGRNISITIIAN